MTNSNPNSLDQSNEDDLVYQPSAFIISEYVLKGYDLVIKAVDILLMDQNNIIVIKDIDNPLQQTAIETI